MTPGVSPSSDPLLPSHSLARHIIALGVTHVVTLPDNTSAAVLDALSGPGGVRAGDGDGEALEVRKRPSGPGAAGESPSREMGASSTAAAGDTGEEKGNGPRPEVIFATREGEAMALASGLWLGGARPVVLIQNTGLLEAGDGLRGTASRMGAPLLLLVTCRGYAGARARGVELGRMGPGEEADRRNASHPEDPSPNGPADGGGRRDPRALDRSDLVRPDMDSVALMTEPTLRAWGIPYEVMRDEEDPEPLEKAWKRAREEERPVAVLLDL